MEFTLDAIEVRVLGCLIEKEATTPDAYPLSLNALRVACNQKTSREPVMDLAEGTVQDAIDSLIRKTLVASRSSAGSRVPKYAHRVRDRLNDEFSFAPDELAVMGLLFLRGPQTRGELRTRSARMHEFADTGAVGETLTRLGTREDGPYVTQLPVAPGHKEARFAHLVSGDVAEVAPVAATSPSEPVSDEAARLAALELEVSRLRRELNEARDEFAAFRRQFE